MARASSRQWGARRPPKAETKYRPSVPPSASAARREISGGLEIICSESRNLHPRGAVRVAGGGSRRAATGGGGWVRGGGGVQAATIA